MPLLILSLQPRLPLRYSLSLHLPVYLFKLSSWGSYSFDSNIFAIRRFSPQHSPYPPNFRFRKQGMPTMADSAASNNTMRTERSDSTSSAGSATSPRRVRFLGVFACALPDLMSFRSKLLTSCPTGFRCSLREPPSPEAQQRPGFCGQASEPP